MEINLQTIRWEESDVHRVEELNARDGWKNHLPNKLKETDNYSWCFYERLIHILEGDQDFDFTDFKHEDWLQVDWQSIKIATEKLKGEEPEEYEERDFDFTSWQQDMIYVREFLMASFGKDFSIPNPTSFSQK